MTATAEKVQAPAASRRNEKVGNVVSTKMQKTIVVEVEMRKAHPKYKTDRAQLEEVLCARRAEFGSRGRCGAHPRDAAAEQAEALGARRDCAPFDAEPVGRHGDCCGS